MSKESLNERLQIIDLGVNSWYYFDIQGSNLVLHVSEEVPGSESHIDAVIVATAEQTVWLCLDPFLLLAIVF